MMTACITGRKGLSEYCRHVVFRPMNDVMYNTVNAGERDLLSWFKDFLLNFCDGSHLGPLCF